jgi:hypothetical protein
MLRDLGHVNPADLGQGVLARLLPVLLARVDRGPCGDPGRAEAAAQGYPQSSCRPASRAIVKVMGDGVLIEFASAIDAVECAIDLERKMTAAGAADPADRKIVLRVGVNLGDVIIEGGDLYGDVDRLMSPPSWFPPAQQAPRDCHKGKQQACNLDQYDSRRLDQRVVRAPVQLTADAHLRWSLGEEPLDLFDLPIVSRGSPGLDPWQVQGLGEGSSIVTAGSRILPSPDGRSSHPTAFSKRSLGSFSLRLVPLEKLSGEASDWLAPGGSDRSISPRRSSFGSLYQAPGTRDPDRADYGEEASQIVPGTGEPRETCVLEFP